MNPLGSPPFPLVGPCIPRLAGRTGAGARLGSPPETPGVEELRIGPTDDPADESAAESGFVGFLRYADVSK